jgi:nitrate reductase gamma subunit
MPALSANALAWHVALAVVVFGFVPHIGFVKRLTGLSWPALPGWMFGVAVSVAFFGLVFALMIRLASPVTRLVSGFDDYASWAVTVLPFLTGMGAIYLPLDAAYPFVPERPAALAAHLLSFELLLAWLPFGKLGHAVLAFASRGLSASAAARKGAAA